MERFFNTSGPIFPEDHYAIPPLSRVDWDEIQYLIASKKYFILHAPRQTGKTSNLLAIRKPARICCCWLFCSASFTVADALIANMPWVVNARI